jgi:hypothetical protein
VHCRAPVRNVASVRRNANSSLSSKSLEAG